MRCLRPGDVIGGSSTSTLGAETVSIIAGDLLFSPSDFPEGGPDLRQTSDYQNVAFRNAMNHVADLRRSTRQQLGNVLFMFDQKGPWDTFFHQTSRKQLKRNLTLAALKPEFSRDLQVSMIRAGLPANFAEQIGVLPEEKLKFLFLNLVNNRNIDLNLLYSNSMVIPKSYAALERGQVNPLGALDDIEEDDDVKATGVSCSVDVKPDLETDDNLDDLGFKDVLARCRAVAASLTIRAATMSDLDQVDRVVGYYQLDPMNQERVNPLVITDGAAFAQRYMGLMSDVVTQFFVKHGKNIKKTTYATIRGETKKI